MGVKVIKFLIESKSKINNKSFKDYTPLHNICEMSFDIPPDLIKFFIEKNALTTVCEVSNQNPIDLLLKNKFYIEKKYMEVFEAINYQSEKVDLNVDTVKPVLNSFCMCENPSLNLVKLAIERGAEINGCRLQNFTALHDSCRNPNISPEILEYLLKNKADPNLENNLGICSIGYALNNPKNKDHLITDLLLKHGLTNYKQGLIYLCSSYFLNFDYLKFFAEKSFGKETFCNCDFFLNFCSNKYINVEMMQYLITKMNDFGIPFDSFSTLEKKSALHLLCSNSQLTLPILKEFCSNVKIDFNYVSQSKLSALGYCNSNRNITRDRFI
eukprot:TRINITY_DN4725_c0_g1_i1.p1 TRINITY_DN4725_c0_g1~~TRINITY_DN4725_c0_g1_i1.p1  ORF type:complete len:377 (+),score=51.19 TRINITY_DN4725_c0_g1_i1:153-1133(+)